MHHWQKFGENPPMHATDIIKASSEKSGTCYSTAYVSQTCDQKRFTISKVAADRRELMKP